MKSALALRIARNETELGIPFPWEDAIDDSLERYLVREAVMTRYSSVRERAEQQARVEAEAAAAGRELLERHLRARGGEA